MNGQDSRSGKSVVASDVRLARSHRARGFPRDEEFPVLALNTIPIHRDVVEEGEGEGEGWNRGFTLDKP